MTAEKADGLSAIEKTYDTTTDAKSILKFGITSADLVSDDSFDSFTVDSSNVSATFDTKNQGSDKDITISGLTITGDNSDQYNVIMPSGVKGTIKKKVITVSRKQQYSSCIKKFYRKRFEEESYFIFV